MKIKSKVLMIALLSAMFLTTLLLAVFYKKEDVVVCDINNTETVYMAINETLVLDNKAVPVDDSIIAIDGNKITALKAGEITINKNDCDYYRIIVTDLIDPPTLNNNKEYLPCGIYTKLDNDELDVLLKYYINKAGYKTRAGVVEAARFISLRFKYRLHYFYENGRMNIQENYQTYGDGEGRYYHEGLYLNEDRISNIDKNGIINGPTIWGCPMITNHGDKMMDNGLDCSGLICWLLYNAGYDVKDIGSGLTELYDLSDLGERVSISSIKKSDLKVGDLIGFDGHIAIIIGMDESNIYIMEEYWDNDMYIRTYSYDELEKSEFEYVMLMDNYYVNDGNLTNMW